MTSAWNLFIKDVQKANHGMTYHAAMVVASKEWKNNDSLKAKYKAKAAEIDGDPQVVAAKIAKAEKPKRKYTRTTKAAPVPVKASGSSGRRAELRRLEAKQAKLNAKMAALSAAGSASLVDRRSSGRKRKPKVKTARTARTARTPPPSDSESYESSDLSSETDSESCSEASG